MRYRCASVSDFYDVTAWALAQAEQSFILISAIISHKLLSINFRKTTKGHSNITNV